MWMEEHVEGVIKKWQSGPAGHESSSVVLHGEWELGKADDWLAHTCSGLV